MYTTILQDSQLARLSKIVKLLKSDFIYVTDSGIIYGFNKDFSIIRLANQFDPQLPECIFRTIDFNTFIKNKCESITIKSGCKSELIPFSFGISSDENFLYSGMYLKNTLDTMLWHKCQYETLGNIVYDIPEFQNDPEFKYVQSLPSTKGAILLPTYGIYIYKGLIPATSKDTIHFTLYEYNYQLTARFVVSKPKSETSIATYVHYLNINSTRP